MQRKWGCPQLNDSQYVTNKNGVSATLCHEDESLQAQRHFHFSKTVLRLLEAFVDFAQQADADIAPKAVSALTLSLQGHSMMSIAQNSPSLPALPSKKFTYPL